jgi:hypothetical protein
VLSEGSRAWGAYSAVKVASPAQNSAMVIYRKPGGSSSHSIRAGVSSTRANSSGNRRNCSGRIDSHNDG